MNAREKHHSDHVSHIEGSELLEGQRVEAQAPVILEISESF
jgi:hypothetical protein